MLRLSPCFLLPALLAMGPAAAAASPAADLAPVTRQRYLMGTPCEGIVHPAAAPGSRERAAAALEAAFEEIARLESILSDYRADSELSGLNGAEPGEAFACSEDLFQFLALSQRLSALTGGAFDLTVGPLVRAWGLRTGGRAPSRQELDASLECVGFGRMHLDAARRTATLGVAGMGLDPGAVGKGYALDAAARVLRRHGMDNALLDFGGQILALGAPEGEDAWTIDVAHPQRRTEAALTLRLRDASASTSGGSERGIVAGGRFVGHVLDPRSGQPAGAGGSVTAIAPTGAEADAFSTALLVMGPDAGLEWAAGIPGLAAVYLTADGDGHLIVRTTPGFETNPPARPARAGD